MKSSYHWVDLQKYLPMPRGRENHWKYITILKHVINNKYSYLWPGKWNRIIWNLYVYHILKSVSVPDAHDWTHGELRWSISVCVFTLIFLEHRYTCNLPRVLYTLLCLKANACWDRIQPYWDTKQDKLVLKMDGWLDAVESPRREDVRYLLWEWQAICSYQHIKLQVFSNIKAFVILSCYIIG